MPWCGSAVLWGSMNLNKASEDLVKAHSFLLLHWSIQPCPVVARSCFGFNEAQQGTWRLANGTTAVPSSYLGMFEWHWDLTWNGSFRIVIVPFMLMLTVEQVIATSFLSTCSEWQDETIYGMDQFVSLSFHVCLCWLSNRSLVYPGEATLGTKSRIASHRIASYPRRHAWTCTKVRHRDSSDNECNSSLTHICLSCSVRMSAIY